MFTSKDSKEKTVMKKNTLLLLLFVMEIQNLQTNTGQQCHLAV